jgi:hypothetical protein
MRALAVFAIIWAVVGAWLCFSLPNAFLTILFIVGACGYVVVILILSRRQSGSGARGPIAAVAFAAKHGAALALILLASICFELLCLFVHLRMPVHQDVFGDTNGRSTTCQLSTVSTLANHSGDLAVVRVASCPGELAIGDVYYLIFVHKIDERLAPQNLVFQYEPSLLNPELSPPPRLTWMGDNVLKIKAEGVSERVVLRRSRIGGVTLLYSFGHLRQRSLH